MWGLGTETRVAQLSAELHNNITAAPPLTDSLPYSYLGKNWAVCFTNGALITVFRWIPEIGSILTTFSGRLAIKSTLHPTVSCIYWPLQLTALGVPEQQGLWRGEVEVHQVHTPTGMEFHGIWHTLEHPEFPTRSINLYTVGYLSIHVCIHPSIHPLHHLSMNLSMMMASYCQLTDMSCFPGERVECLVCSLWRVWVDLGYIINAWYMSL